MIVRTQPHQPMHTQGSCPSQSHGDGWAATAYNQCMQLGSPPIRLVLESEPAESAGRDLTPAAVTLAGCVMTLVGAVVPWAEKATFGLSLASTQWGEARVLLAAVAAGSAGIAVAILLRRLGTSVVALVLTGVAVAQIGAATWFGVTVVNGVRAADPNLILINAIGTGVYMAGSGSLATLAGAILAWTRRPTG